MYSFQLMQVVALLAQKGGAGQTSLALALTVEAGGAGKTVIVLDADPQASACRWRDRRQVPEPRSSTFSRRACSTPSRRLLSRALTWW